MTPLQFPESESRPKFSDTSIYHATSETFVIYFGLGVLFLLFSLGALAGMLGIMGFLFDQSERPPHPAAFFTLLTVIFLACLCVAVYLFKQAPRAGNRSIEITPQGIAQLEKGGSRIFIEWDGISRMVDSYGWQALIVYDDTNRRKISLDYMLYSPFDKIREKIVEEFEKRVKLPALPVTYDQRLSVFLRILLLSFFPLFLAYFTYMFAKDMDTFIQGVILFWAILAFLYLTLFISSMNAARVLTLESNGLILHCPFRKITIPWGEIESIERREIVYGLYRMPMKNYSTRLSMKNGKTYRLDAQGKQLDVFITLRKFLAEHQRFYEDK